MASRKSPPLNLLERVRDAESATVLLERVDQLVERPGRLRPEALAERQWVGVPLESANHVDDDVAFRIVSRCKEANLRSLFAVETERGVNERECFSLPASNEALASFNWELGLMYCALFPASLEWLVLCTRDEHYVVAGGREFVETVLAKPVHQALREFREFTLDPKWSPAERAFLQKVAEFYGASIAGNAE